jgi:hypothetical protein
VQTTTQPSIPARAVNFVGELSDFSGAKFDGNFR